MFISLREKLHSVQEGISASLHGFTSNSDSENYSKGSVIDINSGADILHHYQTQWVELHGYAENNAAKAQEVDTRINNIHKYLESNWNGINMLSNSLSKVPEMTKDVTKLIKDIGSLKKLAENVEDTLIQLEDIIEMEKLEKQQLEERFKLVIHREKRLCELDKVKGQLSSAHRVKLDRHESKLRTNQIERQATFDDAFQSDMAQYKTFGAIPSKTTAGEQSSLTLEEVELECDSDELNEFVNASP